MRFGGGVIHREECHSVCVGTPFQNATLQHEVTDFQMAGVVENCTGSTPNSFHIDKIRRLSSIDDFLFPLSVARVEGFFGHT